MADKYLSEAEWKRWSKGRGLDDARVVKALAALDKARDPAVEIHALQDLQAQADRLRKDARGDKELASYLDRLEVAAEARRKAAEAGARKAEQEAEEAEPEAPELLTTLMVPLLRQVRNGQQLPVLVASAGKVVAVLLSKRAISPSRRKLLQAYLEASSARFLMGECLFEDNAHTFVMQAPAAGLAKKIKAALFNQTGLRLKIRVRGEDGAVDEGDEDKEQGDAGGPASTEARTAETENARVRLAALETRFSALPAELAAKVRALLAFAHARLAAGAPPAAMQALAAAEKLVEAPSTRTASGAAASDSPSPLPKGSSADDGARFKARLGALIPALKDAGARGRPGADEIRLAASQAGVLASGKRFGEAHAALDRIEAWLGAPATPTAADAQAALALWRDAKEAADQDIERLRAALRRTGDPLVLRIADQGITEGGLNSLTGGRMVRLWAALIDVSRQPGDAAACQRLGQAAAELSRFIAADRRIALCERNPYTGPINLRQPMLRALTEIRRLVDA